VVSSLAYPNLLGTKRLGCCWLLYLLVGAMGLWTGCLECVSRGVSLASSWRHGPLELVGMLPSLGCGELGSCFSLSLVLSCVFCFSEGRFTPSCGVQEKKKAYTNFNLLSLGLTT
jgi:hypothetical protein